MENIPPISLFNWSLSELLKTEQNPTSKARIKIITALLIIAMLTVLFTIPFLWIAGQEFQVWRGAIIFFFILLLLKIFLANRLNPQVVSHAILLPVLLVIVTDLFWGLQAVDALEVQLVFIVLTGSLYMLGKKWAIIYSLTSFIIIAVFLMYYGRHHAPVISGELISPAYEIVFVMNFITVGTTIILFFDAFNANIKEKENLNLELQQAINEANRLATIKSEFLSSMSHELRTPLNAVIGMTELLVDDTQSDENKENLEILRFSALNLRTLINDVLDFNKIDSNNLHLESVSADLCDLITRVCAGLRIDANQKGLAFHLDIDEAINGVNVITDPTRLTQIIYNLVGNAIKFTSRGSVTVSLKAIRKNLKEVKVRFSIIDTGIGITEAHHESIFELFTQASMETTRIFGGTGLGLTIVKRLLLLFGSNIQLNSTLGSGSNFFFDIVFKTGNKFTSDRRPGRKGNLLGLRVLVVEDNRTNTLLMKKVLKRWEVIADFASNGVQAVEKAAINNYHIILMDIHMPFMDGFQASNAIRELADPVRSAVPIIALTASVSSQDPRFGASRISDFIYKPFSSDDLYEKLGKYR